MRRLISSLPNDYRSLFPPSLDTHTHTHTHMHANNLSDLATGYKTSLCVDTWKKKREASHFSTFITHIIWYLHLQCMQAEYNYRGKRQRESERERERDRERGLGFICPGEWDALTSTMTICDNSVSCRQCSAISIRLWCRDTRTVGARDEWDIAPRLRDISHFQNKQYRRLKWISPAEGTRATRLSWQAGGNGRFVHEEKIKNKKIHLLGFLTLWMSPGQCWQCSELTWTKTTGSLAAVYSSLSVCIKVWALQQGEGASLLNQFTHHSLTCGAWTGSCCPKCGPNMAKHRFWCPGWVQGYEMNRR